MSLARSLGVPSFSQSAVSSAVRRAGDARMEAAGRGLPGAEEVPLRPREAVASHVGSYRVLQRISMFFF